MTDFAEPGAPGTEVPATGPLLNPEQRQAVEHGSGPLLVLAGAGTGKTRTLVARLAHLVDTGTDPDRILLLTFSRRAADEMVRRVATSVDGDRARRVHAGTFHAVAHRHLRTYGDALGLAQGFSVIDRSDAADLMNLVRNEQGHGSSRRFPKKETLLSIYSRVVNARAPLGDVLPKSFPWCIPDADGIASVFSAYTKRKRAQQMLDYDDLLLFWHAAVTNDAIGPTLAGRYDQVLVDEYQDTNVVQSEILRGLRRDNPNITAVGDDAQSIYSFRAATVRNILDFPEHFPGATIIGLQRNYRSTQPILDVANQVIAGTSEGFAKALSAQRPGGAKPVVATCPDERAQCDAVCDTVLRHFEEGVALRDQAVLFRAAHHSDALEVELRRRNIPFVKYGGLKFLEASHVRDLVAMLRIVDNPYDELAWFRVLQLADGVGPAGARTILEQLGMHAPGEAAMQTEPRRPWDVAQPDPLRRFVDAPPDHRRGKQDIVRLADALGRCASDELEPGAQVELLRDALEPALRRKHHDAEPRLRDLDQLAIIAASRSSRAALVADLTLDPPASTGDLAGDPHIDDDWLTLSTVHSAKGCEWDVVHLIHAADGIFPSDMATGSAAEIDEERRLFYVALTRAREHLSVYAPLRYHHTGAGGMGDAHSWAQRTRFLPKAMDPMLDLRAVRSPADATPEIAIDDRSPISDAVDRTLDGLW